MAAEVYSIGWHPTYNCMGNPRYVTYHMWLLQELAHEEVVRSVKLEQAKEVTKLRQEVEQGAKELASKYERKMKVRSGIYFHLAASEETRMRSPVCPPPSPFFPHIPPSVPLHPPQASCSTHILSWDAFLQSFSSDCWLEECDGCNTPMHC